MGYTEQGEPCEVYFTRSGSAEDYYAPGTYIKISMSKTITLGMEWKNRLFRRQRWRKFMSWEPKLTDRNVDKSNYFIYNFYEVIVLCTQQE